MLIPGNAGCSEAGLYTQHYNFEKMCFKLSKMLSTFAIKFFYKIVQNHQIA